MTAFLFIPSRDQARSVQRVDLANIASLFVETEELPRAGRWRHGLRAAMMIVLVLLAVGDTLLIARSNAIVGCLSSLVRGQAGRSLSL